MAYAIGAHGISIAADGRSFGPDHAMCDGMTKVIRVGGTIVGLTGDVTTLDRSVCSADAGAFCRDSACDCYAPERQLVLPLIARYLGALPDVPRDVMNELLEQHVAEVCNEDRFLAAQYSRRTTGCLRDPFADERWLDLPKALGLTYGWIADGVGWLKQRVYRLQGCDVHAQDA